MRHISGTSRKLGGGNRVSSSDDGDGTVLLGQVSKDVNNSEGSLLEGLHLEHTHGSVHDDGLNVGEELLLLGGGVGAVVKSHPAIRDGFSGNNLGVGISGEVVGNDNVGRKKDGLSKLLGLGKNFLGSVNKVFLDKRGSNIKTLGLEEGENHTSSNDDLVALVKKGVKNSNLGRNLGSSNNGGNWLLSVLDGSIKVLKLLSQKESRDRGLQELGHTLSGGVGTVGGTEGIIDEHVEGSGKLLNESSLVLGLLLVETGVLKHDNISLGGTINNLGNFLSDTVGSKGDLLSEELSHAFGTGSKGELVLRSISGTAQVRADGDDGTLFLQVFDGGDGGADTGIISDLLSVKGDVDVATNQDLLSLELVIRHVSDGFLGLKFESGGGEGAKSKSRGGGGDGGSHGEGEKSNGGVDELHD